jgi:hypothetical protein
MKLQATAKSSTTAALFTKDEQMKTKQTLFLRSSQHPYCFGCQRHYNIYISITLLFFD